MDLEIMLHKPNQLIIITGELTQNQVKLYDCILFNIKEELRKDGDKRRFYLNYTDIKNMSGVDDKNNSRVSGYMKKLTTVGISYGDQKGNFGGFSLISEYDKKENVLEIVLPSKIIDVLISGDYYTTMQLLEQKLLKGKYSVFLYQYLKRNYFRRDHTVTIKELKDLLNIKVDSSYDKDFGKLNNRILIPSIKEININTDLKFKLIEHRTGKKVTKIEIKFDKVIEAELIEDILITEDLKEVINKILKTDLIFIDGKRVTRIDLESAIKDLNKQHKKQELLCRSLKQLVKENKKTVHPINLKSYIWAISKSILEENKKDIKSKDLQGVKAKGDKKEGFKNGIRESKKEDIKKSREEVILQTKKEGLSLKITNITLKGLGHEEVTQEEFNGEKEIKKELENKVSGEKNSFDRKLKEMKILDLSWYKRFEDKIKKDGKTEKIENKIDEILEKLREEFFNF